MSLPPVEVGSDGSVDDLGRVEVMRRLTVALPQAAPRRALEPAAVSDVVRRNHSISFSVDRVGAPVLVRTSYFPNWSVSGADGPYRVTPNFMVVVPTDTEVRLTYGRSLVEWLGVALLAAGVAAALWLQLRRKDSRPVSKQPASGEPVLDESALGESAPVPVQDDSVPGEPVAVQDDSVPGGSAPGESVLGESAREEPATQDSREQL